MIYSYRPGKITDYLTENELLFKILTTYGVSPFIWNGRIRFQLQANGEHSTYRIHDLAFACYHGYVSSYETWRDEMQSFLDWKRFNGFQIDHADSNGHNNTAYNLSLMLGTLNGTKHDIVSRFKAPVRLSTAYVDGEYRIGIIWDTVRTSAGSGLAALYLACHSAEDYVDCLRSLALIDPGWYRPLKAEGKWTNGNNSYFYSDIGQSIAAQMELVHLSGEVFNHYVSGCLSGALTLKSVSTLIVAESP